ncbi:MAG: hypothetical protein ACUVXA_15505 [Candidatus Jordarchaeum sp.]|uniref:hypothetical protein n=1 Tax=Candidatus Jordarchaeum sp. TaxID=2823881 RepID=UPI00404B007B
MGRGALLTGVAGGIIGTIASVAGIAWLIIWLFVPPQYILLPYFTLLPVGPSPLYIGVSILFAALIVVACILTGVGFYGMYTVGGSSMGIVALIFGIIGGVAFGILLLLDILLGYGGIFYYSPITIFSIIGSIILGVIFIIIGSASIVVREYTMHSGSAVAAGILSIIGGCFVILYIGGIIGYPLLFVAFLLWAIVFYTTEG